MATPLKKPDYLRLSCAVQTYAWGKVGLESEVARLKSSAEPDNFVVDEGQTYAELWMGTHVKGSSTISHPEEHRGRLLSDWLESNQWALGDAVAKRFSGDLPFLFKVLSINHALSIQAHPTKPHAELLHKSSPELYRDPNHKPELAIAISNFEGFCGFRLFGEIREFVLSVPELGDLIGQKLCEELRRSKECESVEKQRELLKKVFTALMESEGQAVRDKLENLVKRIQEGSNGTLEQEYSLLLRLNNQFPGDIGCFCVFFLNFLTLSPGEAIYLAPNEPHAYLYGEVMECMACSDNVVRAGLTIKHRDKDTLCQMLTYNAKSPQENKFYPQLHPMLKGVEIYDPPTPEFAVARIRIPQDCKEFVLPSVTGPSILIVLSGSFVVICGSSSEDIMTKGATLFLPASSPDLKIFPQSLEKDPILLFQAYCDL